VGPALQQREDAIVSLDEELLTVSDVRIPLTISFPVLTPFFFICSVVQPVCQEVWLMGMLFGDFKGIWPQRSCLDKEILGKHHPRR